LTANSEYRLRSATSADAAWAGGLVARSGLPDGGLGDFFGDPYVIAEVRTAGGEREPVGVGGVEVYGRFGLLRSVAVVEAWRGRDVGRAIVEDRLRWARERGLDAVYLLTETAAPFFERLGFQRVDRASFPPAVQASKEFSELCPGSAVAMALAVAPAS
jgi:amino-acid N-acetyltransferase